MPLLKPNPSTSSTAVVLDLTDLGRQAERVREQVRREADAVLEAAKAQAARLGEAAEAEARVRGAAAGHAQGMAAGREQGREEARAAESEKLNAAVTLWEAAATGVAAERKRLLEEAETATLQLAVALARRVVARELEIHPEAVVDAVREALGHVLDPVAVTVRLHPQDLELLGEATPAVGPAGGGPVRLEPDAGIARGGCVVEHGAGEVDATLGRKLQRLAALLLGDEVEACVAGEDAPAQNLVEVEPAAGAPEREAWAQTPVEPNAAGGAGPTTRAEAQADAQVEPEAEPEAEAEAEADAKAGDGEADRDAPLRGAAL